MKYAHKTVKKCLNSIYFFKSENKIKYNLILDIVIYKLCDYDKNSN
jgi:hypothetical protein